MNTISLKLEKESIDRLKKAFSANIKETDNPYVDVFIKNEDVTITVYTSGKTVFQGEAAHIYASSFMVKKIHDEAGSDEVGTGDFFGPVCVCACILRSKDNDLLEQYAINDSKQLDDAEIRKIAPILMERLEYSLLILKPSQYNKVYLTNNLNSIKAKMHNQAYINLLHKGYAIPKAAYVDQFTPENTYYNYLINEKEVYHELIFETKAESKHPSVACASMIARYAFLKEWDAMESFYAMPLHKGAGEPVDRDALKFVQKYGIRRLPEIAKMHFKNVEKLPNKNPD